MEKILGIDVGTNSLGWAIVEKENNEYRLADKGVHIFQEGVKIEKGIESSRAAERTQHRSLRKQYFRTKIRKIALLKLLVDNKLCPPLSAQALSDWRHKKGYPKDEVFMRWQQTNEEGDNPYAYRHRCLHEKLDLENVADRYVLGRALYHLTQRRGFLSNRKEEGDAEAGKVLGGIDALTKEMQAAGCDYLGDYFHLLYQKGEKIRNHYTARLEHCRKELHAICRMQGLTESHPDLVAQLDRVIVTQRPLKSQKAQVGHCVFEKNKTKCPLSHPLYEEFRMLSFVNNIKLRTPYDDEMRPLNAEEREKIMPLFFRKSKKSFDFKDIAKKICGKATCGYYKDRHSEHSQYLFNYHLDTSVSGCPVTTGLRELFGDDWVSGICEVYTLAGGKTPQQIVNDVWHALFFYSSKEKLAGFAMSRLQLSEEEAQKFTDIPVPAGYAKLSLKAIGKILPFLRDGMIYSHAVFLANLGEVFPAKVWRDEAQRSAIVEDLEAQMRSFTTGRDRFTLEACVKGVLENDYGIAEEALGKLYHPSMIETYPDAKTNEDGVFQLGSPETESIRNPMAMRSMHRLRSVVNTLLREGKITRDTTIRIEFARELNDANMRKAIADINRENEKKRAEARKAIEEHFKKEYNQTIAATDSDITKYLLWEEQDHKCLYTGKEIGLSEFIGPHPQYDIEHTIPQSAGGDSTMMNLTLCSSEFNRQVKKTKLPSELGNHEEIMQRIAPWLEKCDDLEKQIRRMRTGGATTKEAKDSIIQKRHKKSLERDYWRGKCERFTMETVPNGFSRRQGAGVGLISKYARLYLKSLFSRVFVVKGIATSDFRKMWGLQEEYTKKERVNHLHHCIDAITIACIGPTEYDALAQYYREERQTCTVFPKPWPTFVEDIKRLTDEVLVAHNTTDHTPSGKHEVKVKGKKGKTVNLGDAARGSLHLDTYYGAIERDGEVKYVVRRDLANLADKDIDKIVDETVKDIVLKAVAAHGSLAKAVEAGIWMNEEKRVPIKKVRCFAPSVTNPLHIRHHRDESVKDYKRQYHVANDRNYMMAVYIGVNKKGKEKRGFELVNMLQAAEHYKASNDAAVLGNDLVPQHIECKDGKDTLLLPLAFTLKIGTMVILYEDTPLDLETCTAAELSRRLYKVTGLSILTNPGTSYGRIKLVHHEEARPSTEVKAKNGAYKNNEAHRPAILMYHTQLKALVEGYDFVINDIGEIKSLKR